MPIKHAIWTVGDKPAPLALTKLATERQLEDMIVADPRIVSAEWMLIGRQEHTPFGGILDLLAIAPDETQLRFGYMLEAFRYGAPPHGGIALGFDRLCAMLCGTPSIRDVIAFPKTAKGVCLMTESPTPVSARQLKELYLEVKAAKKEGETKPPA